jgi:hypothetical protein
MYSIFRSLILLPFFLLISCVSAPPSGSPISQGMNNIEETYKTSPNDSEITRREKEELKGRARVEMMKSQDSARAFKNTVLRSNLSERSCPEWRPYFVLEAIECKAVYDYAIYLKLDCEDKNMRINPSTSIKWKVENQEGFATLNNMNAVSVRFKVNRTIKAVGGPPVEDPDMPREFSIRLKEVDFKISSAQSANKSFLLPINICKQTEQ